MPQIKGYRTIKEGEEWEHRKTEAIIFIDQDEQGYFVVLNTRPDNPELERFINLNEGRMKSEKKAQKFATTWMRNNPGLKQVNA